MLDPTTGSKVIAKVKVVARPHKGAGGVAAPTRDLRAPKEPQLRPAKTLHYPQRGRASKAVPIPYGEPGYVAGALPSDAPRIKVAPSTGFDSGTFFTPLEQAQAAMLRRKNLGTRATILRGAVDAATGASQVSDAIHSGKAKKIIGALGMQAAGFLPVGDAGRALEGAEAVGRELEPFHSFSDVKVSANLRSKLNPRNAKRGLPVNPTVKQGGHVVLGPSTPAQYLKRIELTHPSAAERDVAAHWYNRFSPAFRQAFGDHADEMMRGFAVSQANASPTSGLQATLRVMDKLRAGEQVGPREISAVAESIAKAVQGNEIDKGVAAKLSDFIDSLRGTDTRTWMGHAPEGGAPAAIDVHALRDLGYVDQKLVGKLAKRNLKPFEDFVVDSPGVAKGPMYERAAEKYAQIAKYMNKRTYDGRSNWTPSQVQALGWASIQKFHGVEPETLDKALEMNSRTFLPSSISDAHKVAQIVHEEGGFLQPHSVRTRLSVIASPETHRTIAQRMADEARTRVAMLRLNTSKARRGLVSLSGGDATAAAKEITERVLGPESHVHVTGHTADLIKPKGKLKDDERALIESIAARHGAQVSFGNTELEVFDGGQRAAEEAARGDVSGGRGDGGGVPGPSGARAAAEDAGAAGGAEGSVGPLERTAAGRGGARRVQSVLDANAGHDLQGLPTSVKNKVGSLQWHSWHEAQDVAELYMQDARLPYDPPTTYAKVDPERAARIAKAYDEMPNAPHDPEVAAAYQAMIDETLAQYRMIEKTGVNFEFYPHGVDPYPAGPRDSVFDLIRNKHMYVFPTEAGFGTLSETVDHPLLADSGITWGGQRVTHNDLFRAVHDYFGHAKEGVGFRADGEENAWRSHSAMYSPPARRAMTTETRGQNSWVNFGPHGEANRTASQMDTVYADQKAGLLPEWVSEEGAHDAPSTPASSGLRSILADESGSVNPAAFLPDHSGPYEPRTLTHGELEQQLPKSRSRITQQFERAVDHASAALQGNKLVTDTPGLRIVSAGERVAKAAGREQRIESSRRQAAMFDALHELGHIKEGSPEDVANFWYAQLPASHRNAEGLQLIRGKQADELEYITSGKALEDLTKHETAVKVAMKEAETNGEAMRHLRELEELKLLKTDLPQRAQDAAASIGELDKLVAKAPAVNDAAIEAARKLSQDRERILVDSGRLDEERAGNRTGLVSNWLGLEPTGEEAYIGHRLPKPENFKGSYMPSGGTGRVASPKGVGSKNNLVLARTGRLRPSLRVAAEDWNSAQVFEAANVARNDVAAMGSKFPGHVPEGHVLVNPKGRTIPAHWKNDELSQFHESYDDVEHLREQAKEILDGFIATDRAGFERMKQEALDSGVSWDELRVVPKRLVDRYYSQFRATKSRGTAAKVYDTMVDGVATSIVFARVGYIPKNFAQNLIMAAPHQGAFLLVNATRAGQVMRDAELRHLIHAEIGFTGATGALSREVTARKVLGKITGGVSKVADDPMRIAAFLHEAAAEGVISRVNPLMTESDRASLLKLLRDKSERAKLNDIRSRSVEAMADFSRMTPDQARLARRFLIIPGWLMAGSRYPFHFAATHPIRSALLAYIAMGEPGAPQNLQFNQSIDHYFKGSSYRQGIQTRYGRLRTSSLNPVTTPWDLAQTVEGSVRGKQSPYDTQTPTVFDEVQPLGGAIVRIAQGEGVKKSLQALAPNYKFEEGMVHPQASKTYPGDATRLGRLEREIGVVPIPVNDPAAKATAASRESKKLAPVKKMFGTVPAEVRSAENTRSAYSEAEKALKKEHGVNGLSDREQVKLKLTILQHSHPEMSHAVDQLRATVDENPDPEVYAAVNRFVEKTLGWDVADKIESEARKVAKARG